ncbi:DUF930 domain-containing protein [Hyphomicrobium sp.]|uniref:DUF930 domain-containing protein n=1 Tax=Hyphomicrobium sp. TaxID=82 RepID=UPI000F99C088|nr:DUF930 domain-containing protein [Hyphomicrobium sp.]MBN9248444.1 DUF930 domain-containing protein [Hyphomicrobium sp.]RUP09251.1 MAG: DUF930 domain-containing protein [Hyphomicrobium sp.]
MHRWLFLVFLGLVSPASAASMDQSLLKLDPEERAHQACILKGILDINRAKKLTHVDRLKTSILSRATFDGTTVFAKGGAVRANSHWYQVKFTCAVTKDQMKATSFDYEIGPEIPESKWEDLGLWK